MNTQGFIATASMRVAGEKRLPAMDDSNSICNKGFARLGIDRTAEVRRAYRELKEITVPATLSIHQKQG